MTSLVSHFLTLGRSLARLLPWLLLVCVTAPVLRADLPTNWVSVFPAGASPAGPNLVSFQDRVLESYGFNFLFNSFDGELWGDSLAGIPDPIYVARSLILLTVGDTLYGLAGQSTTLTSTDGLSWRAQAATNTHVWLAAAHGNGRFLAAGDGGLDSSPDALRWSPLDFPQYPGCVGLVFVEDHFVLLSAQQGAWLSQDGTTWEHRPVDPLPAPGGEGSLWFALREVNGVCFAFGTADTSPAQVSFAVSKDGGRTWTVQKTDAAWSLTDVAYANGHYVMVGSAVGHSDDALHWTFDHPELVPPTLRAIARVNGSFVVTDSSSVFLSADGNHWRSPNLGNVQLNAVIATGFGFLAVGSSGTILTSTNGFDWQPETSGTQDSLAGAVSDGGQLVAIGSDATILTSSDGHLWTSRHSRTNDPLSWHYSPPAGIVHARGRYVLAGLYLTSTNGVDWQPTPGHENDLYDYALAIIDDGTQFLTISQPVFPNPSNQLGRSQDGLTWTYTDLDLAASDRVEDMACGNGTCVIVGWNFISTSTDSVHWQRMADEHHWEHISYGNGGFVALSGIGEVGNSSDGIHWTFGWSPDLRLIAYKDGVTVALNHGNRLYYNMPEGGHRLQPPRPLPGGGYELGLAGIEGRRYRVQYTTDLQTWTDLLSLQAGTTLEPIERVLDREASTNTFRLYRAIEE